MSSIQIFYIHFIPYVLCCKIRMYSAGLNRPTGGGEAELLGNLSLVGVKGVFCAILSDRELTLERSDGKGLRLSLAAVNRTRHLTIPLLPNGLVPLGAISILLGITTISFPYALMPILLGFLAISLNIFSRHSIISIDTNSGDRHLIAGSEGSLLRLATMISRLIHGSTMKEARIGLENLEKEMPLFPSFIHAGGHFINHDKNLLTYNDKLSGFQSDSGIDTIQKSTSPNLQGLKLDTHQINDESIFTQDIQKTDINQKKSAYESAWNTPPPPWYKEKEKISEDNSNLYIDSKKTETRMDSVLSEAAGQLDMFGGGLDMFEEGGLFDQEVNEYDENSISCENTYDSGQSKISLNQISSSQMMKQAYETYGHPISNYQKSSNLPQPTEIAVREECKTSIVKEARAKQEIRNNDNELNYSYESTNLDSYPSLKKAFKGNNKNISLKNKSTSISSVLMNKLLRPSNVPIKNKNINKSKDNRFQTSQFLRLRSDQDHQSNINSRALRSKKNNENSDAMKVINSIVTRVSDDIPSRREFSFKQMKKTSSGVEVNKLPGIRKLG